jgi:hypothetical protein
MKLTQHDIGGEIISILTKGMYADPKDALREYVQNGVDANATEIAIKIRLNNIVIQDNGIGMDKIVMRKAIRLGVSDKNPGKSVGFMGIGLYSSFHLCERLTILSKISGQTPNKLIFEFKEMREILENQKETRIISEESTSQVALLSLMEEHIHLSELAENDFPSTGTRVELSGLDAEFFESLSKFEEVAEYLEKSIPLPFSPSFTNGPKIQQYISDKCKEHSAEFKLVNLKLQINTREELIYRPYKDSDFNPEPLDPNFKELNNAGEFFGIAWGCLNKANEVIKNEKVRGFLIKKQGFTIGTRNNLLSTFGAKFFNRYVGEFIVVHPRLLPNGARSDFEYSALRTILKKTFEDVANAYNFDANQHQEIEKAEIELDKLIGLYRKTKGEFNGIASNKDLLLSTYSDLSKIHRAYENRAKSEWKIKQDRKKDSDEIIKRFTELLNEMSELLTQKKVQSKKGPQKNKAQIALELKNAPTAHNHKEPQPNNLVEVVELIGIPFNQDVQQIFLLLDEQYLRPSAKNEDDYVKKLMKLKEDIEDLLSESEE